VYIYLVVRKEGPYVDPTSLSKASIYLLVLAKVLLTYLF